MALTHVQTDSCSPQDPHIDFLTNRGNAYLGQQRRFYMASMKFLQKHNVNEKHTSTTYMSKELTKISQSSAVTGSVATDVARPRSYRRPISTYFKCGHNSNDRSPRMTRTVSPSFRPKLPAN